MRTSAGLMVLCIGCSDYTLDHTERNTDVPAPVLQISPGTLDFGAQPLGEPTEQGITISNTGDATLNLSYIGLDEGSEFSVALPAQALQIQPGKSLAIQVQYTPYNSDDQDTLRIVSDDPARPEAWVSLSGSGAFPELQITPNPLLLTTPAAGLTDRGELTLTNTGGATLELEALLLSGSHFSLSPVAVPISLEPGESTWAEVVFSAPGEGLYEAQLWTQDNTLAGNNGAGILGASAVPVARCGVSPSTVAPLQESADWLGGDSVDASGAPLTAYHWTLVSRPAGSVARLPSGDGPDLPDFVADLAGDYVAELIVESAGGELSEPCYATLKAVPDQNLWIELYWSEPNDDMDLHLLRPGGSLRTDGDCYYDNCVGGRLDWGAFGDPLDDPSLDIDDIYGTGPENINISLPEPGPFTVVVHDYQGSTSDFYGNNEVTVNIFLGGQLAWTETRTISGDDSFTDFAEIDWPAATVTALP